MINSKEMKKIRRKNIGWLFVLPGLIGVLIFYIVPFFISIYYTLTKGITKVEFVGINNFIEIFQNDAFLLASKNTIFFMGLGVPLLTIISLALSMAMSEKMHKFHQWALLCPIIIPVASAVMGWSILLGDRGILKSIISIFGGNSVNLFGEQSAFFTIVFIFIIKNMGYMVVIFSSTIASLPKENKEVFMLDSNSLAKYTYKVVIPQIMPIIFFVIILSVMNCFQIFREVYGLYGNFPPNSLYILQYFMNNNFFKLNYQRLSTAAFILTITLSILISIYLNYQNKKYKNI